MHESERTNKLLELLIEIVLDTHSYVDLEKYKIKLEKLK